MCNTRTIVKVFLLCLVFTSSSSSSSETNLAAEESSLDHGYVLTREENEVCDYNPEQDVEDPFSCPPGYRKTTGDGRRCMPCQFDDTVKTYQPTKTLCGTCILCPICKPGEVQVAPCTKRKSTVCMPVGEVTTESPIHHLAGNLTRMALATTLTTAGLPSSYQTPEDGDEKSKEGSGSSQSSADCSGGWMIAIIFLIVGIIGIITVAIVVVLAYHYCKKAKNVSEPVSVPLDDDDEHYSDV